MNELSLYILDIVQNSITANSKKVILKIIEDIINNEFIIEVIDDGKGMDEEVLKRVIDPFFTTRTTRKVGMGIPLFKELCELCEGSLNIKSKKGEGTSLVGKMKYDSIDRPELGDIVETVYLLMINDYNVEIEYHHKYNNKEFVLDTVEIKEILDGVSMKQIDIMLWIKDYIKKQIEEIKNEEEL